MNRYSVKQRQHAALTLVDTLDLAREILGDEDYAAIVGPRLPVSELMVERAADAVALAQGSDPDDWIRDALEAALGQIWEGGE